MYNLDFGMPTLIETSNIEECISLCTELGLQFIEINMNMPQYQIDRLDISTLKKASNQGLYFTFHLDENFNIADFNGKVAQAYMDTIMSTIKIAKELNASVINMHMHEGIHFKLPNEKIYLFELYSDFYMSALTRFRDNCDKALSGSHIKICVENCNGYLPFMKKGVELLLKSDVFKLTFDIGHSYCAKNIDEDFIMKNKNKLYHMHIHDAEGDKCHLVLGKGKINLKSKLSLAESQNCRCVIEVKSISGLRESVLYLKKGV